MWNSHCWWWDVRTDMCHLAKGGNNMLSFKNCPWKLHRFTDFERGSSILWILWPFWSYRLVRTCPIANLIAITKAGLQFASDSAESTTLQARSDSAQDADTSDLWPDWNLDERFGQCGRWLYLIDLIPFCEIIWWFWLSIETIIIIYWLHWILLICSCYGRLLSRQDWLCCRICGGSLFHCIHWRHVQELCFQVTWQSSSAFGGKPWLSREMR